ncbi:MAG: phosphohydrolase [Rhodoferax sp.]|nr:phosphohydrolase [Rhodoferax sp.]
MAQLGDVSGEFRVGEPLPFDILDANGVLLLARGQIVASERQFEQLVDRGSTVEDAEVARVRAVKAAHPERPLTLFDLWAQAPTRLEQVLASITEAGFGERLQRFAQNFVALAQRDVDIAIYLTIRQDPTRLQRYGLAHALHTALVAELAAQRLGWPDEDRLRFVKAALTMNLAVVELQGRLASSENRLTDAQRVELRAHPDAAVAALRNAGIDDATWLDAVAQHHERRGGSGYPAGLDAPTPLAVALRLADVFMAKISPRASRPALPIQEAARQMFLEADGSPVAAAVIKAYGIYPPGDFVQLASGERAVVVRRGDDARTPRVAAITNAAGAPMVDTIARDTREKAHAIVGPSAERKLVVRVPPERLYGLA